MTATSSKGSSSIDLFRAGDWDDLRWYEMAPWFPFYVVYFGARELFRKHIAETSASLAFTTAIAIVPLLSIVISILAISGVLGAADNVLVPVLQQVFPSSANDIVAYLTGFAETSAGTTVGVGIVAYFVTGLLLYQGIERAFNQIWLSTKKWSLSHNLIAAPSLIILGPLFLGLSVFISAYSQLRLQQIGVDPSFLSVTTPFIAAFLVFFVTNYFVPRHKVRWYAALVGGLFTAIAFEFAKWGFNLYVTEVIFEPYERIYGALGLFPIFLIWLSVLWVVVLLGVEFAYATQNLRTLLSVDAAEKRDPHRSHDRIYNPFIGVELYAPIARAFKSGDGPITERQLVEQTGYGSVVIRQVIDTLQNIGALNIVHDETTGETTLIPSKQLDDIWLLPIVESFFDFQAMPNSVPLDHLYEGFRSVTINVLQAQSALTLVPKTTGGFTERRPSPVAYQQQPVIDDLRDDALEILSEAPAIDALPDLPPTEDSSFNHLPDKQIRGTGIPDMMGIAPTPKNEESAIHVDSQDIIIGDYEDEPAPAFGGDAAESVEIEMGDWDDISIDDSLADIEGPDENDLRRTSEIDMSEEELGDEMSSPPPVPDKS